MRIDHVIYAASDLAAAAARIEQQIGVAAVGGGRHDGIGTHNTIVPLGGGYIEVLGVADPEEAAEADLGRAITAQIERVGDGLMGWAVAVDDVEPVAARIGSEVTRIGRQGMTAQLAGLAESMREPFLPFFIARDPGIADPAATGRAAGITWIEIAGDADRLREWLSGGDVPVRIVDGPPAVRAVGVGDRELRTA